MREEGGLCGAEHRWVISGPSGRRGNEQNGWSVS